ncbi:hypothetical protein DP20_3740 [Shigella flexneri]|nr:hypothetical protein DP20_3740 [Shigella flexneri]SRN37072.1 Uncharacterised protein [Shigella flexneri]
MSKPWRKSFISGLSGDLSSSFGGVAFCASSAAARIFVNASLTCAALSAFSITFKLSLRVSILSSRSAANDAELNTNEETARIANRLLRIAHFLFYLHFILHTASSTATLIRPGHVLRVRSPALIHFPSRCSANDFV